MTALPRSPSFRLDGRRALVAGASSGLGLAAAVALAEAGADVTLGARRLDRLTELANALVDRGLRARAVRLDIADIEATAAFVAAEEPFEVLVNAAGLARHSPALATTPEDFDLVAGLNFRAAYFLTCAVARRLVNTAQSGSLINISSQMGHVGGLDRSVYAATKHAVEGFTKAMAIEWGAKGIRVNTICPTFIRTPLAEQTLRDPERAAWIASKIKLGRIGEVEDVMGPIIFLASDASALITGSALMVDGGWTCG